MFITKEWCEKVNGCVTYRAAIWKCLLSGTWKGEGGGLNFYRCSFIYFYYKTEFSAHEKVHVCLCLCLNKWNSCMLIQSGQRSDSEKQMLRDWELKIASWLKTAHGFAVCQTKLIDVVQGLLRKWCLLFMVLAHSISWWYDCGGCTFPPTFRSILLLCDRQEQRGYVTNWCLTQTGISAKWCHWKSLHEGKNGTNWHYQCLLNICRDRTADVSTVRRWAVCFSRGDSESPPLVQSLQAWHAGSSSLVKMQRQLWWPCWESVL